MKTKLIAIAATAAVVLTPLAGVAAASATTEEVASSPAISTSAASPTSPALTQTEQTSTSTTTSATTSTEPSSTASPSTVSLDDLAPADTEPAAGSSPSTTTTTSPSPTAGPSDAPLTSPSSSPLPSSECTVANRGHVHAERVGPAAFRAWADAGYECGAWVATFAFDDGYVPTSTGDYRHPQTALEWGYAQLTTTPTVHAVPAPKCGPFQSDLFVGPLVFHLADGELGSQWRAGGVVLDNPACTPTEEPSSTPTTPAPEPSNEPTEQPTAPVTPPAATTPPTNSGSTPSPTTPTRQPSSLPSAPTSGPFANGGDSISAPTVSPDEQRADALAYTGSATTGWGIVAALALLVVGAYLAFRARLKAIDRKRHES